MRKKIESLYSLKFDKIIGYDYIKPIQIAHKFLDNYPEYCIYFMNCADLYGRLYEERKGKLQKKINTIMESGITQIKSNKVIECLLPKLNIQTKE